MGVGDPGVQGSPLGFWGGPLGLEVGGPRHLGTPLRILGGTPGSVGEGTLRGPLWDFEGDPWVWEWGNFEGPPPVTLEGPLCLGVGGPRHLGTPLGFLGFPWIWGGGQVSRDPPGILGGPLGLGVG